MSFWNTIEARRGTPSGPFGSWSPDLTRGQFEVHHGLQSRVVGVKQEGEAPDVWIFGYGSLIWSPGISFRERRVARVQGWKRRFWQGSHDHRGVPHAPGRVVTLVPDQSEFCDGVAYLVDRAVAGSTFEDLDHREKNGYERHHVALEFRGGKRGTAAVYIAASRNHAFLGPAPMVEMAKQIVCSAGPSGTNIEYLSKLESALKELQIEDSHVSELTRRVREMHRGPDGGEQVPRTELGGAFAE